MVSSQFMTLLILSILNLKFTKTIKAKLPGRHTNNLNYKEQLKQAMANGM